ncbi:MAG: sugar phosphate isomerase/epimerase family protein [Candidatus Melainabacteria bacterium]|nr:sugar phosphate isomerase/epimerase family protein [Candidatus Melainabacteria bacterium]
MIDRVYIAPKSDEIEAGIAYARQQNCSYEIPTFMYPWVLDKRQEEIARYQQLLEGFQGSLGMHGPVFDVNPVSLDGHLKQASRDRYVQAIECALALNCRLLVFHSQYTPVYQVANVMQQWEDGLVDFWSELIESYVEDTRLTVVIENFMDDRPDYVYNLLERVNSPHLKACLDVGHVNLFSAVPPIDWLDALGSNLVYIHAHNNHGKFDEHRPFHRGTIDMEGFLNHLILVRHKVSLAVEVYDMEGVVESYQSLQPMMQMQEEQVAVKSFLI